MSRKKNSEVYAYASPEYSQSASRCAIRRRSNRTNSGHWQTDESKQCFRCTTKIYPKDKCSVLNFYFMWLWLKQDRTAVARWCRTALAYENIASSKIVHINKCNNSKYLHFTRISVAYVCVKLLTRLRRTRAPASNIEMRRTDTHTAASANKARNSPEKRKKGTERRETRKILTAATQKCHSRDVGTSKSECMPTRYDGDAVEIKMKNSDMTKW